MSKFIIKIRTRHPSHSKLRTQLPRLPFRSVVRLGSTTDLLDTVSNGGRRIECNTIQAIKNSSSKLIMKQKFTEAEVKTANWRVIRNGTWCTYRPNYGENMYDDNFRFFEYDGSLSENIEYPIVAKNHFGSRGKGNTLINTKEEFDSWVQGKTLSNYIFEKFHNYAHEFRLHITEEGCFYTCRKALKSDVPEDQKWHFHDDTCVWFLENNEKFFKPNSWNDIISDCVKALKAIGADILAFDVKVQSPTDKKGRVREYQNYILLESNSAPSFGELTLDKYLNEIPKLLKRKYEQQ